MSVLRLGVLGISGQMGKEISGVLAASDFRSRFSLAASPKRGESFDSLLTADAVVEFSSPEAALSLAREFQKKKKEIPLLVGATGWTKEQEADLAEMAKTLPILRASNFSLGVLLAKTTLGLWTKWPGTEKWKISIREVHHARKKDAPSGTALTLAKAIQEKRPGKVPIESRREGDVVGIHEVIFESAQEKLTLIHEAKSRAIFALGALDAAEKFVEKLRLKKLPKRLLALEDLYSA